MPVARMCSVPFVLLAALLVVGPVSAWAQAAPADSTQGPALTVSLQGLNGPGSWDVALQIVALMTLISLAPALLILLTSFTRIVIVLGFLRQAIGTNQMPGNQVIIGLALFLTFVIMAPVMQQVNNEAIQPFLHQEIARNEAFTRAQVPLKGFMLHQLREKDVGLFLDLTGRDAPETPEELPMLVVIPSFIIGELKTAFQMGFILFIPFLIIDMVTASVLMSMGMMMLPPVLISLPFKVLLFVLVDGWYLVVRSLVMAFQ
jgi:flagellar biosynthetic protein FliP